MTELTTPSHLPTPELLAEARRLADAATEGPWFAATMEDDDESWFVWSAEQDDGTPFTVARAQFDDSIEVDEGDQERVDAEFIAASRTLLPELADRLAALTAAVERVEAACTKASADPDESEWVLIAEIRAALEGRAS